MILDVDLGNSALKYRCGTQTGRLVHEGRMQLPDLTAGGTNEQPRVDRVRAASVLTAEKDAVFAALVEERWGCVCEFARSSARVAGVENGYVDPETLGVDRWLAAIAGFNRAKCAVLVVDLGTAATLDYVDGEGCHSGGFIIPGSNLMRRSLLTETAAVRFDDAPTLDKLTPGRQTRDAVERGVVLALVHLIDAELERFGAVCHHNGSSACRLILSGGGAESVARHLRHPFEWVPELVLDGLALALP